MKWIDIFRLFGTGAVSGLQAHQPTLNKLLKQKKEPSQEDAKRAMQAMMKRQRKQAKNRKQLEKNNGD